MILTCSVHALTTVVDVLRGLCALDCTRGHVEAIVEWRGRVARAVVSTAPYRRRQARAGRVTVIHSYAISAHAMCATGFLFGVREAVVAVVQKI